MSHNSLPHNEAGTCAEVPSSMRVLYSIESVEAVDPAEAMAAVEAAGSEQVAPKAGCTSEAYTATGIAGVIALYGLHKVNGRARSGPQGRTAPRKGTLDPIYNRPGRT